MENKQTAMNRLRKHIEHSLKLGLVSQKDSDIIIWYIDSYFIHQEREQILDAFISGKNQQGFESEAENYYNETYIKNISEEQKRHKWQAVSTPTKT